MLCFIASILDRSAISEVQITPSYLVIGAANTLSPLPGSSKRAVKRLSPKGATTQIKADYLTASNNRNLTTRAAQCSKNSSALPQSVCEAICRVIEINQYLMMSVHPVEALNQEDNL